MFGKKGPHKLVRARMLPQTIRDIGTVQKALQLANRTDAVKAAVDIAQLFINALQNGTRIVLENKDGTRESVVIPSLRR